MTSKQGADDLWWRWPEKRCAFLALVCSRAPGCSWGIGSKQHHQQPDLFSCVRDCPLPAGCGYQSPTPRGGTSAPAAAATAGWEWDRELDSSPYHSLSSHSGLPLILYIKWTKPRTLGSDITHSLLVLSHSTYLYLRTFDVTLQDMIVEIMLQNIHLRCA